MAGLQERAAEVIKTYREWYDSIELAPGLVTPGRRADRGVRLRAEPFAAFTPAQREGCFLTGSRFTPQKQCDGSLRLHPDSPSARVAAPLR